MNMSGVKVGDQMNKLSYTGTFSCQEHIFTWDGYETYNTRDKTVFINLQLIVNLGLQIRNIFPIKAYNTMKVHYLYFCVNQD